MLGEKIIVSRSRLSVFLQPFKGTVSQRYQPLFFAQRLYSTVPVPHLNSFTNFIVFVKILDYKFRNLSVYADVQFLPTVRKPPIFKCKFFLFDMKMHPSTLFWLISSLKSVRCL